MSLWFALKDFRARISKIRFIIFTTAFFSADFTFIFILLKSVGYVQMFAPISMFVIVALAITLLHLEDKTNLNIGVLRALGANQSTITLIFLLELTLVGVIGVFTGIILGFISVVAVSTLTHLTLPKAATLTEAFSLIILSCLMGVLAGVVACLISIWKKSAKTVVETLAYTK